MKESDRNWLLSELAECLDSWQDAIETAGPGGHAAVVWQGRVDQALRTAIHFGVIDPGEGEARMLRVDSTITDIRAVAEPDGEGG